MWAYQHLLTVQGTPIIYASFNYRVGPFGFPQGSEAAKRGALNLGLKDQIVALEWIQANIASFGGDPSKVRSMTGSLDGVHKSAAFSLRSRSSARALGRYLSPSIILMITLKNLRVQRYVPASYQTEGLSDLFGVIYRSWNPGHRGYTPCIMPLYINLRGRPS